jgi:ADP-heptose:LPS heptosyltransferase
LIERPWQAWRRVLAVRLDNVGDVIMTGPALRSFRQAIPQVEITLMASPAGAQAAQLLPWVDQVIVHRPIWQETRPSTTVRAGEDRELIERLAAEQFDAAFIFTSFSQTPHAAAYACYLAGIPVRVGESKEFGGRVLTHSPATRPDSIHQVERNLGLLELMGIPIHDSLLGIKIPEEARAPAAALLQSVGVGANQPYLVLAPGASCAARRYHYVRYLEAAIQICAATGWKALLVGSERDRRHLKTGREDWPAAHDGMVDLLGRTSLAELAHIIFRARLLLTNNSGPLHLAEALAVPTTVLYSGTDLESQWRPRATAHVLLRRATPCSPCYRFDCPYNLECLDIPVTEVVARSLELVEGAAAA